MAALADGGPCPTSKPALPDSHFKVVPEFTSLTKAQEQALDELPTKLEALGVPRSSIEEFGREERCAFLKVRNWKSDDAAAQIKDALAWHSEMGEVTIDQIAPFLRTPKDRAADTNLPDGCIILLEDGRGGVARDNVGRPIMMSIGISHGSAHEMQLQMKYGFQRARHYTLPGQSPLNCCTVIEIAPRTPGATPTFRFPDKDLRTIFDTQTRVFPSSLGTTTHFCGLPRAVTWAFRLVKPFMNAEAYDNMKLKQDYSHLIGKHVPAESLLPSWDPKGSFDFDIDAYVEWRAREEGVAHKLCPRGEGRAFSAESSAAAEDAMNGEAKVSAAEMLNQSSPDMPTVLAADDRHAPDGVVAVDAVAVRKHGVVQKQGSGKGLFGNRKWKTKLMVVKGGVVAYFDDTAITTTNFAARIIPLGPGCRVERTAAAEQRNWRGVATPGGAAAALLLVTPAREYVFGCETEDEAGAWVDALKAEISAVEMAAAGGIQAVA